MYQVGKDTELAERYWLDSNILHYNSPAGLHHPLVRALNHNNNLLDMFCIRIVHGRSGISLCIEIKD